MYRRVHQVLTVVTYADWQTLAVRYQSWSPSSLRDRNLQSRLMWTHRSHTCECHRSSSSCDGAAHWRTLSQIPRGSRLVGRQAVCSRTQHTRYGVCAGEQSQRERNISRRKQASVNVNQRCFTPRIIHCFHQNMCSHCMK